MRVTVRNLGVLKEATIDLKPLTIFIGPNNSGQTWLAYALAGVLGPYGSEKYAQAYIEKQVPLLYEELEQAVERVLAEGSATIDLSEFAKKYYVYTSSEIQNTENLKEQLGALIKKSSRKRKIVNYFVSGAYTHGSSWRHR